MPGGNESAEHECRAVNFYGFSRSLRIWGVKYGGTANHNKVRISVKSIKNINQVQNFDTSS